MAFQVSDADEVAGAFSVSVAFTVLVIPPPVTVITPELVPMLAVAVFTLTVIVVPLFDPDDGLTDSQETLSLAVQVPFELTVND